VDCGLACELVTALTVPAISVLIVGSLRVACDIVDCGLVCELVSLSTVPALPVLFIIVQ